MTESLGSRVVKLRASATFVARADGVSLRNNRGSYLVKGKSAYALVRSLFQLLDGSRTVDEICAGLSIDRKSAIERQIITLLERRFAKEVVPPPAEIPPWVLSLYGDQIELLDELDGDPFRRFLQFRRMRVTCVGSG